MRRVGPPPGGGQSQGLGRQPKGGGGACAGCAPEHAGDAPAAGALGTGLPQPDPPRLGQPPRAPCGAAPTHLTRTTLRGVTRDSGSFGGGVSGPDGNGQVPPGPRPGTLEKESLGAAAGWSKAV